MSENFRKHSIELSPQKISITHMEVKTYEYMHQDTLTQKINLQNLFKLFKHKIPDWIQNKTEQCCHKEGCHESQINKFIQTLAYCYIARSTFSLIGPVLNPIKTFKNPQVLLKIFFSKISWKFAILPALYTFLLKLFTCTLRKLYPQKKFDFWAGFFAGCVSLSIQKKADRLQIACFFFSNSLVIIIFKHQLISLQKQGVVPRRFPYDEVALYIVVWSLYQYAFAFDQSICPQFIIDLCTKFGNLTANEKILYGTKI